MPKRKYDHIVISQRTEGMVDASANYYQESDLFFYMQNAQALEYDKIQEAQDDLVLQLSPYTATWGLTYWEESVGLPRRPEEDYAVRRPRVLTRLGSSENLGADDFIRLGRNYGEEIRVDIDPTQFLVTVTFQKGVPTFLEDFQEAVEDIILAHYGVEYKFEYIIKGGLIATTRYSRFLYDVPKAGPSVFCGTVPTIATLGRIYRSCVQLEGQVENTLTDYKKSGTYASGPLPFVAVEGRIYRSTLQSEADGTFTVTTYKQAGKLPTGTVPSVSTEGRVYRTGLSIQEDGDTTLATYKQSGENDTGTLPGVSTEGRLYKSSLEAKGEGAAVSVTYPRAGEIYSGGVKT